MIGTTVKLGFDGAAVQRGLASIGAAMKKMGTTIGRGMFERVGQRSTDALMTLINALPDAIKQTGDFAGEVYDLSKTTGTGVDELVKFFEMLRIGGAEAVSASKLMSEFAKNLHEAETTGGQAGEALAKLGLTIADFEGKSFSEKLEKVMRTVGESQLGFQDLAGIVGNLFGTKAGYKMLAMMKNFDDDSKRASKSTKDWGEYLKKNASTIDTLGDAMGRFEQLKMQLASNVFDMIGRLAGGGGNSIDKLFDSFNPEKLRQKFEGMFSWIGRNIQFIMQNGGFWKTITQGAKEAIKSLGEFVVESLSALWDKIKEVKALAKWFAPCERISDCGTILLMQRVHQPARSEYPNQVPVFLTDLKYSNYGILGKNFVCCDYGTNLLPENGMTKRMKKAKWWDHLERI